MKWDRSIRAALAAAFVSLFGTAAQAGPTLDQIRARGTLVCGIHTGVPGFAAKPNFSNQSVDITFAGEAFSATRVSGPAGDRLKLSTVLPSVFVNYDLSYATSKSSGSQATQDLGAIVEILAPDAMEVEFVAASGRTQALLTLRPDDVRLLGDKDLIAVRSLEETDG